MNDLAKKDIIGVHVNAVGYDDAVARIMHAARQRMALGVSALAVHGLMEGAFDPEHRYRLNSLDLVVPDGTGILWGLNLLNRTRLAERVRGPGLMLKTCSAAAEHGLPIFLFGSRRIILDKLCASLLRRFPRLEIAGVEPSQFR
jgi:N-acetylglucosaminyldiphosphoundecaprenol N-acetyl-beta-D-mannosaminyltransferase